MGQFKVKISKQIVSEFIINNDDIDNEEDAQDWVDSSTEDEIEEASESYQVIHSEYNAEATMNIELIPVDED